MNMKASVQIKPDEEGYLGRECPDCGRYFKIVLGTGLKNTSALHCPYCGKRDEPRQFTTKEQLDYARSVAMRQFSGEIHRMLKQHFEGPIGPQNGFIRLSMHVKQGSSIRIKNYKEKDLETKVTCLNCTLKFAVYGVFGFCPDCAEHNSLAVLDASLHVIEKVLAIADAQDHDVREKLIENAIEDAVSAFDGFGRESLRVASAKTGQNFACSFQNLERAKDAVLTRYGFDIAGVLSPEDWAAAIRAFQKRHLLAHTMGVVDQAYVSATGDTSIPIGHKTQIAVGEVRQLLPTIHKIAEGLTRVVQGLPPKGE